jgi:hypothetical protein
LFENRYEDRDIKKMNAYLKRMQNRLRYKDDLRVMDKLIGNSKAF